jgi:hypothetical protein
VQVAVVDGAPGRMLRLALLNRGGLPYLLQHGEVVIDRSVLDDFLVLNPEHMQPGSSP